MRIPTWRPARISAASTRCPPRETDPRLLTQRSTSTASPSSTGGSGEGPAGTAPVTSSFGQVVDGQVRPESFDPGAADEQMDQIAVGPKPHELTCPGRTQPELSPSQQHVPRRRHYAVELDRPTR